MPGQTTPAYFPELACAHLLRGGQEAAGESLAKSWEEKARGKISRDRNRESACQCRAILLPSSPPPEISSPGEKTRSSAPPSTAGRSIPAGCPVRAWPWPQLPCH